ncbi:MAG: type II toxin-antitoxin system RelE/ParE family toxin [bacterium]|nr:type II toxin-antitoxin system RelE/ParE family toxin [bacterium]
MAYTITFSRSALRHFRSLPRQVQERLQPRIDALAEDPRPPGVIKLQGRVDEYRIRVGNYRVIYQIQDDVLVVSVIDVGHRRDIY